MAEPRFDRSGFLAALVTRRLGRNLVWCAETASTNDDAWDASADGAPDGTVVIAHNQTRGRGRAGRAWQHAPGRGLALSVLLDPRCDRGGLATAPLVAGLALAQGVETLGVDAELKWPNDLLLGGRKWAGILCECRRRADGSDAIVMGVGANVTQRAEDFPPALRAIATSLAMEGHPVTREAVAAAFLNALEPLWDRHQRGEVLAVLDAWRDRARFWGRRISVKAPGGVTVGIAHALAEDGALVVRTEAGDVRVAAGDVALEIPAPPA